LVVEMTRERRRRGSAAGVVSINTDIDAIAHGRRRDMSGGAIDETGQGVEEKIEPDDQNATKSAPAGEEDARIMRKELHTTPIALEGSRTVLMAPIDLVAAHHLAVAMIVVRGEGRGRGAGSEGIIETAVVIERRRTGDVKTTTGRVLDRRIVQSMRDAIGRRGSTLHRSIAGARVAVGAAG
jgi:hypothetical protein